VELTRSGMAFSENRVGGSNFRSFPYGKCDIRTLVPSI
jgi:hypothetical protein